jgi:predicted nucleic acid-binding protein
MRYLLDVNVLVALGHNAHQLHARVAKWVAELEPNAIPQFSTSSITELGFIRIMAQVYGVDIQQAQSLLATLKDSDDYHFLFIADNHDASKLPSWVISAKQTTDGHLAELAVSNKCILATLDEGIPGSFVIPK